jgi:hypothetical protein
MEPYDSDDNQPHSRKEYQKLLDQANELIVDREHRLMAVD